MESVVVLTWNVHGKFVFTLLYNLRDTTQSLYLDYTLHLVFLKIEHTLLCYYEEPLLHKAKHIHFLDFIRK